MTMTSGDLILICDADMIPFPTFLEETLGYFRNPKMTWVQTPQWFYDVAPGIPLPAQLGRWLGKPGARLGRAVERIIGPVQLGEDPFANDPQLLFDVILRRRIWANASLCCGAGSIHRRETMEPPCASSRASQWTSIDIQFFKDEWRRERDSPGVLGARGFQRFRLENQCVSGTIGFQEPRGSMNLNAPAEERKWREWGGNRTGGLWSVAANSRHGGTYRLYAQTITRRWSYAGIRAAIS
jgi:hypothetical protein